MKLGHWGREWGNNEGCPASRAPDEAMAPTLVLVSGAPNEARVPIQASEADPERARGQRIHTGQNAAIGRPRQVASRPKGQRC